MKARQNQPESAPRGSFRCTPVECSATTVVDGRRTIRFAASVPLGVLAVLPVRKNRLLRPKFNGLGSQRRLHVPHARRISPLKSRH